MIVRFLEEDLLKENKGRFVLFPIECDSVWSLYKKHEALLWETESTSMKADEDELPFLEDVSQLFIKVRMRYELQTWLCKEIVPDCLFFFLTPAGIHRSIGSPRRAAPGPPDGATDPRGPITGSTLFLGFPTDDGKYSHRVLRLLFKHSY